MSEENKEIVRKAPDSLKLLWKNGFFKEWRNYCKVVSRLSQDGYHFPDKTLGMALLRAKYLTRRGERGKYEYIQRHPFVVDEKKSK